MKRKGALRLVMVLGAAVLGLVLWRASPREVVLVYDLRGAPGSTALGVRIDKGGVLYREAEFYAPGTQVRHTLKLPDGTYHLRYVIGRASQADLRGDRDLQVTESQTIVLSLGP